MKSGDALFKLDDRHLRAERVDTRALQVIYRIEDDTLPLFVGQQMDLFIEAADLRTATATR